LQSFSLGKQRLYSQHVQEAIVLLQRALDLDPGFAMAHEYLGISYWHAGDLMRARQQLYEATQMIGHVTEVERHKILGDYLGLIGNYDAAIPHFQLLAQLQPQDPAAHLNLGGCYEGKFLFDDAIRETQQAVDLQPIPTTRDNLADIYFLKGDTARVLSLEQESLRDQPHDARALDNIGRVYLVTGKLAEARSMFEQVLGSGEESKARAELADLDLATGRYHEARSQLETGIAADTNHGNTYAAANKKLALASIFFAKGDHNRGRALIWQIEQLETDPRVLLQAGIMYARNRRSVEAYRMMKAMAQLHERFPSPALAAFQYLLRAELALAEGNAKAAVGAAETAIQYENSTFGLEILARMYAAGGDYQKAIATYEHVLSRQDERASSYDAPAFHTVVEIHYRLGSLYQDTGQLALAREHFKTFLSYWSEPDADLEIYNDARKRSTVSASRPAPARGAPTPAT
jgi:tetratricopeptide (TPR) repeat protein